MNHEQVFLVDGARVSFSLQETGPLWQCGECSGDCEHILIAAARMTLNSWELNEEPAEDEVVAE